MKIEFRKITSSAKAIDVKLDSSCSDSLLGDEHVSLVGEINRKYHNLIEFNGKMIGKLNLVCAKSGAEFTRDINECLVLYFSDGIWEMQSQISSIDILDVIEFFEGFIDFNFVLESEIESIRLDYNIKE